MLEITAFAAKKIKSLMEEDPQAQGLRVYVKGGGCSGYSYGMLLEVKIEEEDTVFFQNEVKVIVDPQSMPLLIGSTVDYSDSLQGAGFQIKNPAAKTTCGCGSSFSV
jgi:iron-sulfur cluster assembly accessory protein